MDIFAGRKTVFCLPHLFLWKSGGESGQDGLFSKFPRFLFCLPVELSPHQLKTWLDGCWTGGWVWPLSALLCNPLTFREAVPPMTTRTFGGFALGPAVSTSDCPYKSIKWVRIIYYIINSGSIFNQSWKFTSHSTLHPILWLVTLFNRAYSELIGHWMTAVEILQQ